MIDRDLLTLKLHQLKRELTFLSFNGGKRDRIERAMTANEIKRIEVLLNEYIQPNLLRKVKR